MTKDTSGPAFPASSYQVADFKSGMSLRDYFAAKAMHEFTWFPDTDVKGDAAMCYKIADAMLEARK